MSAPRIVFSFWGRRGGMSLFALRLAEAAARRGDIEARFIVSADSELRAELQAAGPPAHAPPLFSTALGAALRLDRLLALRALMHSQLAGAAAWIELMPHVWSPLVADVARAAGVRRAVVIHDAHAHEGDPTGWLNGWINSAGRSADRVLTLSEHVARQWSAHGGQPARVLFHPDLVAGGNAPRPPASEGPLRVLFLGRIAAYKGLPLLIAAAERLQAEQRPVELGVFGEGDLAAYRARLAALGAEVRNEWLAPEAIGPVLARYDVLALPYVEASQSGVAALGLAAGLPLVATPVGALSEQVRHGVNGWLAEAPTAEALTRALDALAADRAALARLREGAVRGAPQRSMDAFLSALLDAVLD